MAALLRVAIDEAKYLAHEGGAEVKGEGIQGGEGRKGVGEGSGATGVGSFNRGRAGGQDDVRWVGQRAAVNVGGAGGGDGDGWLLTLGARKTRQGDKTRLQTIRAFLLLRRVLRTGKEHLGGGASIRHIHIQPGQGDGILDDGRNGRRRWREILGCLSGSIIRAPPNLTEGPGEESSDLVVRTGNRISFPIVPVGSPAVIAEEGCVPKYIATAAHVHGVAEVSQRRANHVHR